MWTTVVILTLLHAYTLLLLRDQARDARSARDRINGLEGDRSNQRESREDEDTDECPGEYEVPPS